ncbi:MAG: nucleotidyltransferase domain-containing protein [Hylemonella sp.]
MLSTSQSAQAQSSFAQVAGAAQLANVRTVSSLPGSFSTKKVKGRAYVYYQTPDLTGKQTQIYVGPASPELETLIEKHRTRPQEPQQQHLRQLTRVAIAAGCSAIIPTHAKIIGRLADAGFFHAGGILIGTHVYLAYQNLLGVTWGTGAQTLDLDFAHAGKNVSIALPASVQIDTPAVIDSLRMGFVPIKSLTTYVKSDEPDLQLDFVTTMHRGGDKPVKIDALNVTMQPLKFLEFSMENPIQLVLLSNTGPIVVNAPPPEKYAIHKLLVHGERPQAQRTKASKDLDQAAALIEYLAENDTEVLREAWQNLTSRGSGWKDRARQGREALHRRYPEIDLRCLAD